MLGEWLKFNRDVCGEWLKIVQNANRCWTDCSRDVVTLYLSGRRAVADVDGIDGSCRCWQSREFVIVTRFANNGLKWCHTKFFIF